MRLVVCICMNAVFRNSPRKGETPIGYRPVTGNPRDEKGRIILEYVYAPKDIQGQKASIIAIDEAQALLI